MYLDFPLTTVAEAHYVLSSLGYIVTTSYVPPIDNIPNGVKITDYSNLDALISQIPGGIKYSIWEIKKNHLKPIALRLDDFDFINKVRLIFGLESIHIDY
ncbi:MAG: hypothetical protein QXR96_03025 [Candidatus Woesearchaeota archaeon]